MKRLKTYINERFIASKSGYNYFPPNVIQLRKLIEKLLNERGPDADLNDIDVSKIEDMVYMDPKTYRYGLFCDLDIHNIDISK